MATEAERRASKKYLTTQDEIKIRIPKGQKAEIQAHVQETGETLNGFCKRAIKETMSRDRDKA